MRDIEIYWTYQFQLADAQKYVLPICTYYKCKLICGIRANRKRAGTVINLLFSQRWGMLTPSSF